MTQDDYAAMVHGAGHDTLFGIPGKVTSAATLRGDADANLIENACGIETLSTALEAIQEIDPNATTPGLG